MGEIKFSAMYPKEGNDHMTGFALLIDGTLVRVAPSGDGLAIHEVKIEDKRTKKPITANDLHKGATSG